MCRALFLTRRCGTVITILDEAMAIKTYSFKVVLEPDEDAEGKLAWYAYCPALADIVAAIVEKLMARQPIVAESGWQR